MQIVATGDDVRAVGETKINDRSSRSHTVFSLNFETRDVNQADAKRADRRRDSASTDDECTDDDDAANDDVAVRSITLSLVELAG